MPAAADIQAPPANDAIRIVPLSPACGAAIEGVDLTKALSQRQVDAIKAAGKYLVLVFSRPESLAGRPAALRVVFRRSRQPQKAPEPLRTRAEGVQQDHEKVLLVTNIKVDGQPIGAFGDGEFWFHIDSGYAERPYKYTFLYAVELPSTGGNTMFSNMYSAYDAVPAELKDKLKGKKALHIHEYNRAKQAGHAGDIGGIPHFSIRYSSAIPTPGERPCSSTG